MNYEYRGYKLTLTTKMWDDLTGMGYRHIDPIKEFKAIVDEEIRQRRSRKS